MENYRGECFCGSVHISIKLGYLNIYSCYCHECQKHTGGVFMFVKAKKRPDVCPGTESLKSFYTASHGYRFFCAECGGLLFIQGNNEVDFLIPVSVLDFTAEQKCRMMLIDELQHHLRPTFFRLYGRFL